MSLIQSEANSILNNNQLFLTEMYGETDYFIAISESVPLQKFLLRFRKMRLYSVHRYHSTRILCRSRKWELYSAIVPFQNLATPCVVFPLYFRYPRTNLIFEKKTVFPRKRSEIVNLRFQWRYSRSILANLQNCQPWNFMGRIFMKISLWQFLIVYLNIWRTMRRSVSS